MNSNVFICSFKKSAKGYKLWVKSNPQLSGEGTTYDEAAEKLSKVIWDVADDLDAIIPTALEFDPPLPPTVDIEKYCRPELYIIKGDEIFDTIPYNATAEPYYKSGYCRQCLLPKGTRNNKLLELQYPVSTVNGGWVRGRFPNSVYIFSERFLSLLKPEELSLFEFREVQQPPRTRRAFYELAGKPIATFVGVNSFDMQGWECSVCGNRYFNYFLEPCLHEPTGEISQIICRADLPEPVPSCFPVGFDNEIHLCMTRARWDEIRGCREAKGLFSKKLGVISEKECVRHPRLPKVRVTYLGSHPQYGLSFCHICDNWVIPQLKEQCVWGLPAKHLKIHKMIRWLKKSISDGSVIVTREPIPFDQIVELFNHDKPPLRPIVFSFRCPDCWRLGRIIVSNINYGDVDPNASGWVKFDIKMIPVDTVCTKEVQI